MQTRTLHSAVYTDLGFPLPTLSVSVLWRLRLWYERNLKITWDADHPARAQAKATLVVPLD